MVHYTKTHHYRESHYPTYSRFLFLSIFLALKDKLESKSYEHLYVIGIRITAELDCSAGGRNPQEWCIVSY
jgi:hypothetical protein